MNELDGAFEGILRMAEATADPTAWSGLLGLAQVYLDADQYDMLVAYARRVYAAFEMGDLAQAQALAAPFGDRVVEIVTRLYHAYQHQA